MSRRQYKPKPATQYTILAYLRDRAEVPTGRQMAAELHMAQQTIDPSLNLLEMEGLIAIQRGPCLDPLCFPGQVLAQIQLLAANGTTESFRLEIDKIWLE